MTLRCKDCLHSAEDHPVHHVMEPRPCTVIGCLCSDLVPWWDWR